eukprot:366564-Chlamydomonas_euryale.AAC.12
MPLFWCNAMMRPGAACTADIRRAFKFRSTWSVSIRCMQARSFRSSPYFRQELPGGAGASTRGGGRPLDANNISADEQHPAAASAADEPADAAKAEPRDKAGSSAATPARSVHSPLQSLMDAAAAGSEPALSGGARPAVPLPRTWAWYDAEDEREEQRRERKGLAERWACLRMRMRGPAGFAGALVLRHAPAAHALHGSRATAASQPQHALPIATCSSNRNMLFQSQHALPIAAAWTSC